MKKFLTEFKSFSDLVSNEMPTLSLVQLMKTKIMKLCSPNVSDDECIRTLKMKVKKNVDRRFPITKAMKISQLLDPETKDVISRHEASDILEKAMQSACAKQLIRVCLLAII